MSSNEDRPARVEQCIRSVGRIKPDLDELTAEALCGDLYDRGVLGDPDEEFDGELPIDDDELAERAEEHDLELSEQVKQCEKSILADNPAMDRSTAIAICQDMENRGVLEAYNEAETSHELVALAQFRNPGSISRAEEDGGVVYRRVMLLAPGTWTDAGSRQTIEYAADAIRASADNWTGHDVNLLHGPALHNAEVLGDIGEVRPESIIVDDRGRLFADIFLHGDTAASELAIELMDEVLQAANDPARETPPVGPSVEISDDTVERRNGRLVMQEMTFAGLGLVFNPASEPVEMGSQVAERAVAMADGEAEPEFAHIRALEDRAGDDGDSLLSRLRHRRLMADDDIDFGDIDFADALRVLNAMQEDLAATAAALTDRLLAEHDATQDLIAEFRNAGNDPSETTVADLLAFAADAETEIDEAGLQELLDAFMQSVDADAPDAVSVEAFADWLDAQEPDDEGEEGGMDEEAETQETMSDELKEAVSTIGEYADQLETVKDMLQAAPDAERIDGLEETLTDVSETVADVEKRLEKFEAKPSSEGRALTNDAGEWSFSTGEDDEESIDHEDVIL